MDTGGKQRHPVSTERLMRYWTTGPGGQLIDWGRDGDFDRCVVAIQEAVTEGGRPPLPDHEIKGLCRNLHVRATGAEPGHAPGESRPGTRH